MNSKIENDKGTEPRNQKKTRKALNQLGERVKHDEGDNNLHGSTTRSGKNKFLFPRHTTVPKIITSSKYTVVATRDLDQSSAQFLRTPNTVTQVCHKILATHGELGTRVQQDTTRSKSNKFKEFNEKSGHVGKHKKQLATATCGRSPTMYNVPCRPDQTWSTPNTHGLSHKSWLLAHQRWRSAFARSFHPAPRILTKALLKPRTQLFLGCLQD